MKSQMLKCLLLMVLTALITAFITCYFCKKKHGDHDDDGTRSLTTICMDYDNVQPATLTTELVKSMVTTYRGNQLNNIQTAPTNAVPQDAQAIWFDLETLKTFLYHIEHNVDNHTAEGRDKKLGVRIYYAAYPKNEEMKRMAESQTDSTFSYNPSYEKLHTLVMIPTISGKEGENYDFNPLDATSYNGFVNMKKDAANPFMSNNYTTLTLGGSANPNSTSPTIARNHGSLIPPASNLGLSF
jgi:hypothetical protein